MVATGQVLLEKHPLRISEISVRRIETQAPCMETSARWTEMFTERAEI